MKIIKNRKCNVTAGKTSPKKYKYTIKASREDYERYGDENGVIWSKGKWEIIDDGYGLGISDGYTVDRPIIYEDGSVAYDYPEWLPAYVKNKFASLAKSGKIKNRHTRMNEVEARDIESSTCNKNKFTVTAASTEVSQDDVEELVLYIVNDGTLYNQFATPIIKNMKRKRKNGNYNDALAVKGWMHLADEGVRKYDIEFGSGRGSLTLVNKATREEIARELKDYYEEEISFDESINSSVDIEDGFLYRVVFEYTSEIVRMDDVTSDYQTVLDTCIDQMEAEGNTGYLYTLDEVEEEGWYEDEYVIGGNHGLALYHGGNFNIEPIGWSNEVGNITASVDTNHNAPRTYDTDSKSDAEYLKALGDGVIRELNKLDPDKLYSNGGEYIYDISDSAITFTSTGDGSVIYIQPLDHIEPNMDDLEEDIEELLGMVWYEISPKF